MPCRRQVWPSVHPMLQRSATSRLAGIGTAAFHSERPPAAVPSVVVEATQEVREDTKIDLDQLAFACIGAFRDHSHLSNVLTHISRGNWREVEQALRSIFDSTVESRDLSPLARNLVELMCADRGVTGRIMKPYFRNLLASELQPAQARRLSARVTTRFLELEVPNPFGDDDGTGKKIAIVRGRSTAAAQKVFQDVIERWGPQIRIAGLIEERNNADGRVCRAGQLRSIADNVLYSMFQIATDGTAGCDIETTGLSSASDAVCRDVAAGCDLVILSKFGKLEAAGQGLRTAFAASVEAKVPLLTYVPSTLDQAWESFAGSHAAVVPAEPLAIDDWLRSLGTIRRSMMSS